MLREAREEEADGPVVAPVVRLGEREEAPHVVPGGELGNDPPVPGMHLHLGVQGFAEEPVAGVVEGDPRLVAGGLDAEDEQSVDCDLKS